MTTKILLKLRKHFKAWKDENKGNPYEYALASFIACEIEKDRKFIAQMIVEPLREYKNRYNYKVVVMEFEEAMDKSIKVSENITQLPIQD